MSERFSSVTYIPNTNEQTNNIYGLIRQAGDADDSNKFWWKWMNLRRLNLAPMTTKKFTKLKLHKILNYYVGYIILFLTEYWYRLFVCCLKTYLQYSSLVTAVALTYTQRFYKLRSTEDFRRNNCLCCRTNMTTSSYKTPCLRAMIFTNLLDMLNNFLFMFAILTLRMIYARIQKIC